MFMRGLSIRRRDLAFWLVIAVFIGFVLGTHFSPAKTEVIYLPSANGNGTSVEMPVVAVGSRGEGVIGKLITTAKPGTGLVLVNVNNVLAQYDTQLSGRTAAHAAANFTGIGLQDWDII